VKKILSSPFLFPIILVLLTVLICFLNYTPNTFLTGWDTLHPEFNFSLNFQRLLKIWHSEQGLGDIPAHAQIADIPRVFILYLFHFILPLNFLRYSYIFLCLILGPLGFFYLIKFLFSDFKFKSITAFTTAIFYLFNLSTVQQFYLPFEMFPTQWAFLPWIVLFSLKFLKNHSKKDLILFSLFTLFATPQAYASQLWYAFFAIYLTFLFLYALLHKQFKNPTILITLTLLINAFWLIPNLFYISNFSSSPLENRDNRLYSQEYFLKNRQNGYLSDTTIVKGFYLDWSVFSFSQNTFIDLMPQWKEHTNQFSVLLIGHIVFILSLIGLIISLTKKDKLFISFLPFFIIPFILLTNQIPPFSYFFNFITRNPTIKESFRFIFTKLSILLIFGITIFLAYSINFIFQKIKNIKNIILLSLGFICLHFYYAFPIFQGYLISPSVKVNIPNQYFQFWKFMASQDNGRILSLPLNQSSGWQYYGWGYQGSGFLWFNLKQDLLDRDSDRWNFQNEESYREFFNNLYNKNSDNFFKTLNKYKIKYIIWDKNIINPGNANNDQITFKYEITDILSNLEENQKIKLVRQFENLSIYKTVEEHSQNSVQTINNFISPPYTWGNFDSAFPDYITTIDFSQNFLFRNYLDKVQKLDTNIINPQQISQNLWQINFSNIYQNKIPPLKDNETIIPSSVYFKPSPDNNIVYFDIPIPSVLLQNIQTEFNLNKNLNQIKINDKNFSVENLSQKTYLGQVNLFINDQNYLNNQTIDFNFKNVSEISSPDIKIQTTGLNFNLSKKFQSLNKTDTYSINLDNLPQSYGYIIGFKSQYTSGIPLRFCFKNLYSLTCSVEDQFNQNQQLNWDFFVVPPSGQDIGYLLDISNISYGNLTSQSYLDQIAIIPIPFNLLSKIQYTNPDPPIEKTYFISNQSYSTGWKVFYFNWGIPTFLKNHVLANNWANAWELPANKNLTEKNIHIFFLPQIFQYLGLIITVTTLIVVFKKKNLIQ
jgi:hypothetical protein